jgi:hypothetical protein
MRTSPNWIPTKSNGKTKYHVFPGLRATNNSRKSTKTTTSTEKIRQTKTKKYDKLMFSLFGWKMIKQYMYVYLRKRKSVDYGSERGNVGIKTSIVIVVTPWIKDLKKLI